MARTADQVIKELMQAGFNPITTILQRGNQVATIMHPVDVVSTGIVGDTQSIQDFVVPPAAMVKLALTPINRLSGGTYILSDGVDNGH